jgi:hypothetical protein
MSDLVPVVLVKNDSYWLPYVLETTRDLFKRYVIYNIGSTDSTGNIIDWFLETQKDKSTFYVRHLPHIDPEIQGIFRNSMIAEAMSEFYFILDGDEIYKRKEIEMLSKIRFNHPTWTKIYGIVNRVEMASDLKHRYDRERSHHRIYHRTAIWKGTHPGERPVISQRPENEEWINGVTCYHFHNPIRSPKEEEVPKRLRRKQQQTYHPGKLIPFDLLEELPILRKTINGFPVNPELEKMQHANNKV